MTQPIELSTPTHSSRTGRPECVAISFDNLRVEQTLPFPLYTFVQDSLVLYLKEGQVFETAHRRHLADLGESHLWLPVSSRDAYFKYLEDAFKQALAEARSADEKMSHCFDYGTEATRHLMNDPASEGAHSTALYVVQSSAGILDSHGIGFKQVSQVMRQNPDLYAHSMQVCLYGLGLARRAGIRSSRLLEDLGLALLMHDVGKVEFPSELMTKRGRLTDEEWAQVQQHPLVGLERTRYAPWVTPVVRDVIQNHHERMDGTGYPRGIKGKNLSVGARIAAIVNAFDSRTTHRPHRPPCTSFEALQEMVNEHRGAFDPKLLEAFVRTLSD